MGVWVKGAPVAAGWCENGVAERDRRLCRCARRESDFDDGGVPVAQRHDVLRIGGQDRHRTGGREGGGADHGVDGVLVAVQAGVGEEGGGVPGDGLGDRFDDEAGQGPFQGRPIDPWWITSTRVAAEVITRRSSARARASQPVTVRSRRTALASPSLSRTRVPPGTAGEGLTQRPPRLGSVAPGLGGAGLAGPGSLRR